MLSTEELLKPRYKVIADYPYNTNFTVGNIITLHDHFYTEKNKHEDVSIFPFDNQRITSDFYNTYPHLFKPLQWWEERKPKDMPKYVLHVGSEDPIIYYKVDYWFMTTGNYELRARIEEDNWFPMELLPAYESDYINQDDE